MESISSVSLIRQGDFSPFPALPPRAGCNHSNNTPVGPRIRMVNEAYGLR